MAPPLPLPAGASPLPDLRLALRVASMGCFAVSAKAVILGLCRRYGWFTTAFHSLVWVPLSGTLPFSLTLVFLSARRWLRDRVRSGQGSGAQLLWSAAATWARLWALLEVLHYVGYRVRHRAMSRQRHLPPRTRQARGRRLALLQQQLRSLELALTEEEDAVDEAGVGRRVGRCATEGGPSLQHSAAGLAKPELLLGGLRRASDASSSLRSHLSAAGMFKSMGSLPSSESLLREWEGEGAERAPEDRSERLLRLKREDMSGWFWGADAETLRRGNLEEWLAEYFFHHSTPDEIAEEDRGELRQMVDEVATWVGCPSMPDGTNPMVRCKRLSQDPVQAMHRPLFFYTVTGWILPAIVELLCKRAGFEKFTAGVIPYWHRPAQSPSACAQSARDRPRTPSGGGTRAPIVFCHGLGVGVLPYVDFVTELGALSGAEIFLLDLKHISLRQHSDVPSSRETVACVVDMLAAWGHSEAHFVGHSFGTIVVSWLIRNSQVVLSASLLDPVCFLLIKHDTLTNALYKEHVDPVQVLLTYTVFREQGVAHTLARNFFWHQNDLPPEDIMCPALVLLSGKDEILPAFNIKRRLCAEQRRRRSLLEAEATAHRASRDKQTEEPRGMKNVACSCVDLHGTHSQHESELRGARAPLELLWFADIVHCEFSFKPPVRTQVVEAVGKLCRSAEAREHRKVIQLD